jgi:hypothetical protein
MGGYQSTCLEAKILGGAYLHERWSDLSDCSLVALCQSNYHAELLARALAENATLEDGRSWVVTDSHGGSQQVWNRARIEREATKAQGGDA